MHDEIKKPSLDKPKYFNEPYDYRNIENVGYYYGVGDAGKIGSYKPTSINPMPDNAMKMYVPRDHKG